MGQLVLSNVSKSFGSTKVLVDIDLDVRESEFVVFVGPSGCGKSTLLRMVAGLEDVTGGDIVIDGNRVNDLAPVKRGIAMVFQSYALYPHMTVYENIAFPLRVEKMTKDELDKRVRNAARILQLEERLEHKPGALSGGQRQRVAIGRAIVREPQIFLFDEPLSNLDAALRAEMRIELANLHRHLNATMIYVTHDQVEAMTMADRIVVLNDGVIAQVGSPLELYHLPDNEFVAGFIGNPRMNFLPVTCTGTSGAGVEVQLFDRPPVTIPVTPQPGLEGQSLTLGIRPEHCGKPSGEFQLDFAPQVIERLGIHSVGYGKLAPTDTGFCAIFPGTAPVAEAAAMRVSVAAADCHLFDPDGKALKRNVALTEIDPSLLTTG